MPLTITYYLYLSFYAIICLCSPVGVGQPLTPERTRRLLALRINILAKGYSGISLKVLQQYVDGFNGEYPSPTQ